MARRKRRKFGFPPAEHRTRMTHAYDRMEELIGMTLDAARHGDCSRAAGSLATAEYLRGRGDAEAEGAGEGGNRARPAKIGKAYEAVSKCRTRK
jgi:hypothetical protein